MTGLADEFSTPTESVVLGIAERTGKGPTELPPLNETIDPDAFNRLVRESECQVSFTYAGYDVTAAGPADIEIHQVPGDRSGDRPGP